MGWCTAVSRIISTTPTTTVRGQPLLDSRTAQSFPPSGVTFPASVITHVTSIPCSAWCSEVAAHAKLLPLDCAKYCNQPGRWGCRDKEENRAVPDTSHIHLTSEESSQQPYCLSQHMSEHMWSSENPVTLGNSKTWGWKQDRGQPSRNCISTTPKQDTTQKWDAIKKHSTQ